MMKYCLVKHMCPRRRKSCSLEQQGETGGRIFQETAGERTVAGLIMAQSLESPDLRQSLVSAGWPWGHAA